VPFFNGIKKKLYFNFESHFRRVPFFNGIKKNLFFSFESPWRISGSPNDIPLQVAIYCILARSMETSELAPKRPCKAGARKTPYNMDFPLQPVTRCLLKLLLFAANFAYALVEKALLKNR
jgi:hypothetical protein